MDVAFKFNYGIDFEKIRSIAQSIIEPFDKCLQDPPPRIGVQQLDPDGFIIIINAWTKAHCFQDTKLAFQERLMKNVKSAGIKLPGMS